MGDGRDADTMIDRVARAMAADAFSRSGNPPETREGYIALVAPTLVPFARAAVAEIDAALSEKQG